MVDKPLLTLEIPQYLRRVMLSKKRRAAYYKKGSTIPKRYRKYPFDEKGFLVHPETGKRILKNPRTAGKPRYLTLSGNSFTSNTIKFARAKAVDALKRDLKKKIGQLGLDPIPEDAYPIRIEWDVYTPVGRGDWDMDNLWFFCKYTLDALRALEIIPEDNIQYITHSPGPRLIPVERDEDRKFVFRFYRDERPCIRHHTFWNKTA